MQNKVSARPNIFFFSFCKYITLYQYLVQYVLSGPNASGASWQYSRFLFTERRYLEYDIALASNDKNSLHHFVGAPTRNKKQFTTKHPTDK